MTFRLLSCDGGGIRGYITSKLIQALNQKTDKKLLQNVNGYAGTSTGGLISIALAAGVSIDDVVKIYQNDAATIFTENYENCLFKNNKTQMELAQTKQALAAGPGYLSSQYTSTGLQTILSKYLGKKTFADITDTMLTVTSAQLYNNTMDPPSWSPAILNNLEVDTDYSSISLMDAALATSAAPTYFPPHQIGSLGYFADGGIYANNPVLNGAVVALKSGRAVSMTDIQVISIGTGITGEYISTSSVDDPLCWGTTHWLWPSESNGVPKMALLNLALALSAQNNGDVMSHLLGKNLVRIDPILSAPVELDGYTANDYKIMNEAINDAQNSSAWSEAVDMVKNW